MKYLQRLLREPLLHFFVIGGIFFVAFGALSDRGPPPNHVITITPARIEQLAVGFTAVWRRQPTAEEVSGLIEGDIREEVYYREALALGMDRGDTVIRRRMRQKMEFLTDTGADLLVPSEDELQEYLSTNEPGYRQLPRVAIEQIYLGDNPEPGSIPPLLDALNSDQTIDPLTLGQRTLLPLRLDLSYPNAIDGVFGAGFFDRIAEFPTGRWTGPVGSTYGIHLLYISAREPSRMPPLNEVRAAVLRDWKSEKSQELRELYYERLKEGYTIEIERGTATADPQS
jgi:hypothetical protein